MCKMKRIMKNSSLLLIAGILVLSVGFIFVSCGKGPTNKVADPFTGAFAQDNTDCNSPAGNDCAMSFTSQSFTESRRNINNKEVTMEVWIKPKSSSTMGTIFSRGSARGVTLSAKPSGVTSTPVTAMFSIRRVVSGGAVTGTLEYTVEGMTGLALNTWYHIAGILTNEDHSTGVNAHTTCTGPDGAAEDDPWHIDIYVDGKWDGCSATHDGGASDPTPRTEAYAQNPEGLTAGTGSFQGIVDEARLWTVSRVRNSLLQKCMMTELGYNFGDCGRRTSSLIAYWRFNEGSGDGVNDFTGLGVGGREYQIGPGIFGHWDTGWTTDVPDDVVNIRPAD